MPIIALPTEIQYEAARAYLAEKPAPAALKVEIAKTEAKLAKPFGELEATERDWLFGLLDATNAVADDEAEMTAHRPRATKKKSWFASIMASFGI